MHLVEGLDRPGTSKKDNRYIDDGYSSEALKIAHDKNIFSNAILREEVEGSEKLNLSVSNLHDGLDRR